MAAAYGGFAEGGRVVTPTPVIRVTGPDGAVIVDDWAPPPGPQVIDPAIAGTVTATLQQVIERGTGTAATIDRPAAGKTGTTDQLANAWFVGYTPVLVTAAWVGNASGNVPMRNVDGVGEVFGGTLPALIWHDTMLVADHDIPPTDFGPAPPLAPPPPPGTPPPAPPFVSGFSHRSSGSPGGGQQQAQAPAPAPAPAPGGGRRPGKKG
jgi:penicillin-binding protein 1A